MQVKHLKPHLDTILLNAKWNFDLEDIDKILRVESGENIVLSIIDLLSAHHFSCEELK
jgi:hypothetical protein